MRKPTAFVAIAVLFALVLVGVLANHRSAAQAPAFLQPVPKWEYKTIRANLTAEAAGESELGSLGEEGWELCAAVQPERGGQFLILKRPITIRGRGRGDR